MKRMISVIIAFAMVLTVFAATASAAEEKFILIYLGNGGLGAPTMKLNLVDGQEVTVVENTKFSNGLFDFTHWNTAADGTGTDYYPGDTFVIKAEDANESKRICLYAQWVKSPDCRTLTYSKNTDDPACVGTLDGISSEHRIGERVGVRGITDPICGLSYYLHKLVEWNTEPDGTGAGYQPSESITIEDNTTLYAIWENAEKEVEYFTVTFDANGGEGEMLPETDIPANGSIMAPSCEFFYEGYNFVGWNTAADGTGDAYEEWDDITVVADLTLYAMWEISDEWDYNPEDGEAANLAVAVAVSTLALGALVIATKKKD